MAKKKDRKYNFITISLKPETKERFVTKFKKWDETDDEAMIRLLDLSGVNK